MTLPTRLLIGALLALALLFAFWFIDEPVALAVFALPPLLLAALNWTGSDKPAFWSGLLALLWFSHGVMVAWSRPPEREWALIEVALSLIVVLAASLPGLHARFRKR
jgi:uncharacterized membrane protein